MYGAGFGSHGVKWKIPARQKAASGSYKGSDAKKVSQWLVQVQGCIREFGGAPTGWGSRIPPLPQSWLSIGASPADKGATQDLTLIALDEGSRHRARGA